MGFAIGHHASSFFGLGSMSTFGNILLKSGVGKEYATIRNILNIRNLSVISGSIESGNADAKNLSCFLPSNKSFHQLSSNPLMLLPRPRACISHGLVVSMRLLPLSQASALHVTCCLWPTHTLCRACSLPFQASEGWSAPPLSWGAKPTGGAVDMPAAGSGCSLLPTCILPVLMGGSASGWGLPAVFLGHVQWSGEQWRLQEAGRPASHVSVL